MSLKQQKLEPISMSALIGAAYDCWGANSSRPDEMRVSGATETWMRSQYDRLRQPYRYPVGISTILRFDGCDVIVDDDCVDGEIRFLSADNPRINRTFFFEMPS